MDDKTLLYLALGAVALYTVYPLLKGVRSFASDTGAVVGSAGDALFSPAYVVTTPLLWIKNLGDDDKWLS